MSKWIVGVLAAVLTLSAIAGAGAQQEPADPETANVDVTVWRRVSDPSLLYVSTRPEGGRWRTVGTALDMSALSSSGKFHESNAIRVEVTLPGPNLAAAPAPDLVVDTPTVDTSAPAAGARFTRSATVRNHGNGSLASTRLRYYRSTDATITSADIAVGTDSVFRLDASETGDESISLTAPSDPGTYYYGACVDTVSDESDTNDNCSPAASSPSCNGCA